MTVEIYSINKRVIFHLVYNNNFTDIISHDIKMGADQLVCHQQPATARPYHRIHF